MEKPLEREICTNDSMNSHSLSHLVHYRMRYHGRGMLPRLLLRFRRVSRMKAPPISVWPNLSSTSGMRKRCMNSRLPF